jgi:5-methylcytosine-specific restriction endonuclease McrA
MRTRRDTWARNLSRWRAVRAEVFARAGGQCQIRLPGCTGRAEHVDHIVPRALGGPLWDLDNLRAACAHCNERRRVRYRPASDAGPSREW